MFHFIYLSICQQRFFTYSILYTYACSLPDDIIYDNLVQIHCQSSSEHIVTYIQRKKFFHTFVSNFKYVCMYVYIYIVIKTKQIVTYIQRRKIFHTFASNIKYVCMCIYNVIKTNLFLSLSLHIYVSLLLSDYFHNVFNRLPNYKYL